MLYPFYTIKCYILDVISHNTFWLCIEKLVALIATKAKRRNKGKKTYLHFSVEIRLSALLICDAGETFYLVAVFTSHRCGFYV